MIQFIKLRAKTYAYLMDDDSEHKEAKGTRKCLIKKRLSNNDDNRLQIFDKITIYPYRANAFKVCESEMLSKI